MFSLARLKHSEVSVLHIPPTPSRSRDNFDTRLGDLALFEWGLVSKCAPQPSAFNALIWETLQYRANNLLGQVFDWETSDGEQHWCVIG